MTLKEELLQEAEDFCVATGMSKARLATIVINDGKFFERLKAGGDCTTSTLERFRAHFSENRPDRANADAA